MSRNEPGKPYILRPHRHSKDSNNEKKNQSSLSFTGTTMFNTYKTKDFTFVNADLILVFQSYDFIVVVAEFGIIFLASLHSINITQEKWLQLPIRVPQSI